MNVLWFSCGAASAVMCKIALEDYPDARIVYIETGSGHEDNARFLADCERWYGREIETIRSQFYGSHWHVIEATRYINGPAGARCTTELKRKVRKQFELDNPGITAQMFGMTADETARAERKEMKEFTFPLIEAGIVKNECYERLLCAGIELPMAYKIGLNNNNCLGCVKGGKGYWGHLRKKLPEVFNRMALLERKIGRSCINGVFLDELPEGAGRHKEPDISCGLFCMARD